MSDPIRNQPSNNVLFPTCPHCRQELPAVGCYQWAMPGFVILCVYCHNPECRATLHFSIVPIGEQEGVIARPS